MSSCNFSLDTLCPFSAGFIKRYLKSSHEQLRSGEHSLSYLPVVLDWILMENSNHWDDLFGRWEKYDGNSVSLQVPWFLAHVPILRVTKEGCIYIHHHKIFTHGGNGGQDSICRNIMNLRIKNYIYWSEVSNQQHFLLDLSLSNVSIVRTCTSRSRPCSKK